MLFCFFCFYLMRWWCCCCCCCCWYSYLLYNNRNICVHFIFRIFNLFWNSFILTYLLTLSIWVGWKMGDLWNKKKKWMRKKGFHRKLIKQHPQKFLSNHESPQPILSILFLCISTFLLLWFGKKKLSLVFHLKIYIFERHCELCWISCDERLLNWIYRQLVQGMVDSIRRFFSSLIEIFEHWKLAYKFRLKFFVVAAFASNMVFLNRFSSTSVCCDKSSFFCYFFFRFVCHLVAMIRYDSSSFFEKRKKKKKEINFWIIMCSECKIVDYL